MSCQETKKKDDTSKNTIIGLVVLQKNSTSTTPALGSGCNTSGISTGCTSSSPFSCTSASSCYSTLAACQANSACTAMYGSPPQNGYYAVNSAISTISTTIVNNNGETFSVSPSLPTGLSLNTTNGQISGTPTATTSSKTTYTITATFGSTNFTGTLSLQIVPSLTPYTCGISGSCTTSPAFYTCTNSSKCYSSSSFCASDSNCAL